MTDLTFDLYASGQYMENYGAHDWDGEGECPQYWKCKGSDEVKVMENVTLAELPEALKAVELRIATGEFNYSCDSWSRDCSSVVYLPHGATMAVKTLIEYGMDMGIYCFPPPTENDMELAQRFRRFMGLDNNN
jgi:hypothetical protein